MEFHLSSELLPSECCYCTSDNMKQRILKDRLNFHSDPVWGDKGVKLVLCFSCIIVLCFSCISPVSQAVTVSCTFLLASHMGHTTLLQGAALCVWPALEAAVVPVAG